MNKNFCIISLIFFISVSSIHAESMKTEDVLVIKNNDIYLNTEDDHVNLTNDGKEKDYAIISNDRKIIIYNDLDFNKRNKTQRINLLNVMSKKIDKRFIVNNITKRVTKLFWINDKQFVVFGKASENNEVMTIFETNNVNEYLVFAGRKISMSPDNKNAIFLSLRPRFIPEEFDSDIIIGVNLDYVKELSADQRVSKYFCKTLYPYKNDNTRKKYTKLKQRHNIISEFIWLNNHEVMFIDNTMDFSYLIIFEFKDNSLNYMLNKIKLSNYFQNVQSLSFNYNTIIIHGNADNGILKNEIINYEKK